MNFLNTFRGRLLVILAFLLIATLGVQYYLNLKTQTENNDLRQKQTQALVAGIALGINGVTSRDRIQDIVKSEGQTFFDQETTERIKDIIVVNPEWQIYDSLNSEYLPAVNEDNETIYKNLSELKNLPPLMEAERLGEDRRKFPNADAVANDSSDGETYAIPIETSDGRFYVMVILENDKKEAVSRAARPLIYTLGILSISTIITIFLVWRFTRPISNLSNAARLVAEGDLSVRVEDGKRTDEIGQLASRFNEMIAELEKTRQLEAQLQQAEKSAVVGRLGSAIAHEIRNPLNYINLTLDHLRVKFAPEDENKRGNFEKLTSQLKTEVGRINQQITDFLSYSRPAKANLQPINVRNVIEDSLRIVEAQAEEQNIEIKLAESENTPPILGDAEFLRSVFNNLFINAVQSMESNGGNLDVKIAPENDFVTIEIIDTGKGISEESLAKIFEPYFSTKETGTGLGLAIVQKIVDAHNGTIAVESKLDEGTKFVVKLPKAKD
ncbi:MAG: ATP-binding protein [Acidobacteriota bacterium]|nr:ATP-binding protein [Acidobacteriota bacterium]